MATKVPLQELANLFSHLGANTKAQISSAFAEAEDMMNFSNNSNINTQDRRALSAAVSSPTLTVTTNNRGFDVTWVRLPDRSISSYEVQVSFDSIFANPTTYNVVDTSLALEGIGTTVYVRVRGVTYSGDTGNWSDTSTVNAFATTAGPVVYTRGFNDVPSFYQADPTLALPGPIQHLTITPQRQNGGIVVFGSLSLDSFISIQPGDSLQVKLNATVLDDIDLGGLLSDHINSSAHGFALGFGPAFLTHEGFGFSAADGLNPSTATQSGAGVGTHSGWNNLANATGVMEEDYTGTEGGTDYTQTDMSLGQGLASKDLKLTNWGAAVPGGNTITGIEVTFTGNYFGVNSDTSKSKATVRHMRLIDETGTVQTFDQTTTAVWPFTTATTPGNPIEFLTFGGPTDLWGKSAGFWTPAKVNSINFGVDIVAGFHIAFNDATAASFIAAHQSVGQEVILYGMSMTVFSINEQLEARIDVILNTNSGTASGALLGCTLNAIEFGSALS